jgi:hypothetical protein
VSPVVEEPRLSTGTPILVSFKGHRAAEGPMTLGQLGILQFLSAEPDGLFGVVIQPLEVPEGTRVADVRESLAVMLARHEGLRTTHGAQRTQRVAGSGTLRVDNYVLESSTSAAVDRAALGALLVHRLRTGCRAVDAPPLRVALVTRAEVVEALVIACNHFVCDLYGMHVLKRELTELLVHPELRSTLTLAHQALDQAEAENTPLAKRRQEATVRYLERELARMPQCLYPAPRCGKPGESLAASLHSWSAVSASSAIAERSGLSRSTIVLAAVCKVLSERIGMKRLTLPLLTANRFDRALRDYVGTLTQDTLATLDVDDVSFEQLARRLWMSTVMAGKHGAYDVFRLEKIANGLASARGISFDWGPLFNNMLVEAAEGTHPTALAPLGTVAAGGSSQAAIRWRSMPPTPPLIRFDLLPVSWPGVDRGWALSLWSGNTEYLPAADMEGLLLAFERLLVAAADKDLSDPEMRAIVGLLPIERGDGWLWTDSCWIDLRECQRLLDDALAPGVARLVPQSDEPLVAYLVSSDFVRTPEQAHARCMAALAGRKTAMAPRRYVVWQSGPDNRSHSSGWAGLLHAGTGRSDESTAPSGDRLG